MDVHEKYVTMKKFGSWQLGNQMFQYLFLNYVSKITQRKIIFLYENNDELENYKKLIKLNTYFDVDYIYIKYNGEKVINYFEKKFYDENILKNIIKDKNKYINIVGFFQSYKYYNDIHDEINNCFVLKNTYLEKTKSIISKIREETEKPIVSLHVRRGDYVKYLGKHTLLELDYYIEATKLIKENLGKISFIICSDDIKWCERAFFSIEENIVFIKNTNEIEDMYLMSLCDHHIISNSSFSLLSTYLNKNENKNENENENKNKNKNKNNGKLIIAPKIWFGVNGPKFVIEDIHKDAIFI